MPILECTSSEERSVAGRLNHEWRAKMQSPVKVDFSKLAREITNAPEAYAPPKVRGEEPNVLTKQVEKFGELPTVQLDDMIAAAERELAQLKKDAQVIRDTYVKYTSQLTGRIKRLQESVSLSINTMQQLRDQCERLEITREENETLLLPFEKRDHA